MPATKAYTRVNFENYPSTNTPLNATNLNKVDKGIDDLDDLLVTARNNIETLQSNATTDEANILALQGETREINNKLSGLYEKLWENPSPNSNMSATTIQIDLSDYDYVDIVTRPYIGDTYVTCQRVFVGQSTFIQSFAGSAMLNRNFTVSATGITITDGNIFNVKTEASSTENSRQVPIVIYGGKLLS